MLMDSSLIMSDAQAITAAAAGSDYIDQGAAGSAIEEPCWWIVNISEAFNTLTSLTISLRCHEDSLFGTGVKTLIEKTVPLADLTLNANVIKLHIPPNVERYIQSYYTVTGTAPTTGKVTSFIALDPPIGEVTT